jgi:hypothetical protein
VPELAQAISDFAPAPAAMPAPMNQDIGAHERCGLCVDGLVVQPFGDHTPAVGVGLDGLCKLR